MRRLTHSAQAAWLTLSWLLATRPAGAIWEDDEGNLIVDGSFRNTTAVVDHYDSPLPGGSALAANQADGLSASSLRLTANGTLSSWFSYELHAVQEAQVLTAPEAAGGFEFTEANHSRYRLLQGSHEWVSEGDVEARLFVDRASLRYDFDALSLTFGRQAITLGKARFWNPLDVFLPFDSRQFDREYKRGVDALRADVPLGDMSGVDLVAATGRADGARVTSRSWYGSALLARAYTNLADWDFAAQGGKIYGGYQLGAALTGVAGPIELRGEAAYFLAAEDVPLPNHLTCVLGVGRLFDSSLNLQAEYLYNGAADSDLTTGFLRVAAGRTLQVSEHLVGASVSYDLLPILTGSFATIVSLTDDSAVLQPGLMYSIADESDILVGALVALGQRPRPTSLVDPGLRSEFGTYPNFYYAQYRFYF